MRQRIAGRIDFPSSVNEVMRMLRCVNGVKHDREIAAGRILHAAGNVKAADSQTVLLVFDRTRADRYIGDQVIQIIPVLRIEHLIRS